MQCRETQPWKPITANNLKHARIKQKLYSSSQLVLGQSAPRNATSSLEDTYSTMSYRRCRGLGVRNASAGIVTHTPCLKAGMLGPSNLGKRGSSRAFAQDVAVASCACSKATVTTPICGSDLKQMLHQRSSRAPIILDRRATLRASTISRCDLLRASSKDWLKPLSAVQPMRRSPGEVRAEQSKTGAARCRYKEKA